MSQTLTRLLIHIVFSTKHRADLIAPEIENELHRYICGIARSHESPLLVTGGTANHVHLLTSLSKNIALADLVMHIKKDSSKWIKTKGAAHRAFRWQDGYSAFSIGESGRAALTRYIQNQKAHHRKMSCEDEIRKLVKKYDVIEFDERHAWD